MHFMNALETAWQQRNSLLCVGLDPDPAKFPAHLQGRPDAIFEFCKAIVDATADLVCCFKPQIAYFAAHRAEDQLEALIAHIHAVHPDTPVILDAKRGDIGSTAEQYAIEAFERFKADAITVNPYMGRDSVDPYLAYPDKGCDPAVSYLQPGRLRPAVPRGGTPQGRMKLYEHVARTSPKTGTPAATAAWWSAPPSRPRSRACASSPATCRCWCQASAPRAATLPRRSPLAARPTEPG
jgi:orotidine 5''-phosphate decarboxylase, subfamily 2